MQCGVVVVCDVSMAMSVGREAQKRRLMEIRNTKSKNQREKEEENQSCSSLVDFEGRSAPRRQYEVNGAGQGASWPG